MTQTFWRIAALAALLACCLIACTKTPAVVPERVALEGAIQRWVAAVNSRDSATLKSTMTEDVELLDDAATVVGRAASLRALSEVVSSGKLVAITREITIAHDVAWHVVELSQKQKNGDVRALGQALEIWKRVNGEWKLHRRMAADVSPGASVTRPSTNEPVLDHPKQ
jgi:ketosteroid isomerase-like protein